MNEYNNLKSKVKTYTAILHNTTQYREEWHSHLKDDLINQLETACLQAELDASIEVKDQLKNLEAIILSLGKVHSGIYEDLEGDMKRQFVRLNGSLVYQQLFNGKIIVMIVYPFIEGLGEPRPSRMIAIYRPEELKPPFIIRHMEEFIKEMAEWEDYDDDDKQSHKIGFNVGYQLSKEQEA
jgi:hypothetical protein